MAAVIVLCVLEGLDDLVSVPFEADACLLVVGTKVLDELVVFIVKNGLEDCVEGVESGLRPHFHVVLVGLLNALFGAPFDEERYSQGMVLWWFLGIDSHTMGLAVIDQCGLTRDLALFDAGDQTEVGEKGLTLRYAS